MEQNRKTDYGALLGLDMGGTHTDAVLIENGHIESCAKVPTIPENPAQSMENALRALFAESSLPPQQIVRASFGTTAGMNALVQNRLEKTGLILAAGPGMDPLTAAIGDTVHVLPWKLDHRGSELSKPKREDLEPVVRAWRDQGIRTFACAEKFSIRNPAHELTMESIIRDVFSGDPHCPFIALSHRSGLLNFPRRAAAAFWNAALAPLHRQFAQSVEQVLKRTGITAPAFMLRADGGTLALHQSADRPLEALLSGPAASIMGAAALCRDVLNRGDTLVLDMGGTTTDISLFTGGEPLLAPKGLVICGRATPIRALHTVSIGLGGDSVVHQRRGSFFAGPNRDGPAAAFGGSAPTFVDCLNGLGAKIGDTDRSRQMLRHFAVSCGAEPDRIVHEVIKHAQETLRTTISAFLEAVNSRPVHTLSALVHCRVFHPQQAVLIGGPAYAAAPFVEQALGMPVTTLSEYRGSAANAIGAALTCPSASLDLFADTMRGRMLAPAIDVSRTISSAYSLRDAEQDAISLLRSTSDFPDRPIDITESHSFATLDFYGRGGRDIRVSCRLRPEILPLSDA
ncbi:MAG: hydantoinase/oxoprolinase family protein [Desulfovibrionaceae bacterium]|nr:hydantoinase/oxoprolinase family protein [Desulfovibrionaceae bacterium]